MKAILKEKISNSGMRAITAEQLGLHPFFRLG